MRWRRVDIRGIVKGYKEKINPVVKVALTWDKELLFTGRTQEGYEINSMPMSSGDASRPIHCSSLAGCMGIDIVMFLQKMRTERPASG